MGETIPAVLVEFLGRHVRTVGQLEVLLLFQADSTKEWNVELVSKTLRANIKSISIWLEEFREAGLLSCPTPTTYRYAPRNSEIEKQVQLLSEHYKVRPFKIIEVITNRPTNQMMSFLDAFKIKKEDPHGDR